MTDRLLYHIVVFQVFPSSQRCNCMISVEVTETGVSLSKVAYDIPKHAKTILKKAVTHAKGHAEQLTPVRTGLMRQSWYVTMQSDLNSALSNRATYFLYFILGTSPHEIRPRFASVLRFQSGLLSLTSLLSGELVCSFSF